MTKTVWKYEMDKSKKEFRIPPGASPLRVGIQRGTVCLWFCVVPCPEEEFETRHFLITATGHEVPMLATYIGGFSDGGFEWHVWETKLEGK